MATGAGEYCCKLMDVCSRLVLDGKIIVSSKRNFGNSVSYPAMFDSVIGVEGGIFCDNSILWFNRHKSIQCVADGVPVIVRTGIHEYTIGKRNSKATAVVTGMICCIIGKEGHEVTFDDIFDKLDNKASIKNWTDSHIYNYMRNLFERFETGMLEQHKAISRQV